MLGKKRYTRETCSIAVVRGYLLMPSPSIFVPIIKIIEASSLSRKEMEDLIYDGMDYGLWNLFRSGDITLSPGFRPGDIEFQNAIEAIKQEGR